MIPVFFVIRKALGSTLFVCTPWLFFVGCDDGVAPLPTPAHIEIVSGALQTSPVGTPMAQPVAVRVFDTDSVPLPGRRVDFRVAVGHAQIASPSVETDAAGVAQTVVTPVAAGTIHVIASVFSTGLSERFLLAGAGPGSSVGCGNENTLRMAAGQVELEVGGNGICVASRDSAATFALLLFNAPTTGQAVDNASITITAAGTGDPPMPLATLHPASRSIRAVRDRDPAFRPGLSPSAVQPSKTSPLKPLVRSKTAAVVDTVGQLLRFNVNLSADCADPVFRTGRVMALTTRATIVIDTAAGTSFDTAGVRRLGTDFDDMVVPAVAGNFLYPADLDSSGRVTLFVTDAVNGSPAIASHPLVAFARRDLMPSSLCAGSNEAELLYVAAPSFQMPQDELLDSLTRHLSHSLQHLINASRRIYVNDAQVFEDIWLDEGLSQVAEEVAFHRAGSWFSRNNLNALHLTFTSQSRKAFHRLQSGNAELYRQFLTNVSASSPLSDDDEATTRGAAWSLLRYLVDQRAGTDFVLWTRLANSTSAGFDNLTQVFGPKLTFETRDWALSLLTDDLFATVPAFQQPSWNFRSIFSALGIQPYPLQLLPLGPANPIAVILSPAGAAYATFTVPATGVAAISWSGAPPAFLPPTVMWAVVRVR